AGAAGLGVRRRRLAVDAAARALPRRLVRRSGGRRRRAERRRRERRVRGPFTRRQGRLAGTGAVERTVDRGRRDHRRRRPRPRRAGELHARRRAREGARRGGRRDARSRRRGLVPVRRADRPDRQGRLAEALRRPRHLGRDPAQGRHAELERDRRDQQGSERTDLRVQRPRRRRRRARDRPEADRAREAAQGRLMAVRASDYPPPFDAREYVVEPTDPEDERIEVGVLVVGAGPAGLACAVRLGQLLEEHPDVAERLGDVPVAVVEKGKQPGSHLLSGAVVNPRALRRLFKDRYRLEDMPSYGPVHDEAVYVLTKRNALRIPPPPTMRNHGNWIFSLSQLGRWLAERAEEGGAMILPETAAEKLLVSHGRVVGVRTGDKGRSRGGEPMGNFEHGADLVARVTVLAEGTQGHLTGVALDRFGLRAEEPQVWELGVKEVWRVPRPLRSVIHTMG